MARRSDIDWEAIEREYRLGQKTNQQIAREFGIQPSSLGRRAEKYDWVQDKTREVRTRSKNMLIFADAKNATGNANINATPSALDIKVAARARTDVVLQHRGFIKRALNLTEVMLGDLEVVSSPEGVGLVESLLDAVSTPEGAETPEDAARRRSKQKTALEKALGLDARVDTLKRVAETIDRLVQLERQAYGILDKDPEEGEGGAHRALSDAERASRAAAIFAVAMQRRAEAPTDVEAKPANAS